MPDHWHGLVELGEPDGLSRCIQRLKANSSRRVHESGLAAKVWAAGFHDRALRSEEHLNDVARYVIRNPIRAGIVAQARDYRWWGAVWAPLEMGFRASRDRD
jgi:REP element-mobilizing transposase RayT